MNKEEALRFSTLMGSIKPHYAQGWIRSSCPFAKWRHIKGSDKNPSFGVSVHDDGYSICNCFTCGIKTGTFNAINLLRKYHLESYGEINFNFKEAYALALADDSEEQIIPDFVEYEDIKTGMKKKPITAYSESWLSSFSKAYHHPYLSQRGIPPYVAEALDLRYDSSDKRICVPIRTASGTLAGFQGRDVTGLSPLRYRLYDHKGSYNPDVWLMEHTVDTSEPVVICEGFFDLAKIYGAYTNIVGALTTQITEAKYKRLQDAGTVITFFDKGTGGNKGRALVSKYWKDSFVHHILPPDGYDDAGEMPIELIADILDEII